MSKFVGLLTLGGGIQIGLSMFAVISICTPYNINEGQDVLPEEETPEGAAAEGEVPVVISADKIGPITDGDGYVVSDNVKVDFEDVEGHSISGSGHKFMAHVDSPI